jgi:hypothetical protein
MKRNIQLFFILVSVLLFTQCATKAVMTDNLKVNMSIKATISRQNLIKIQIEDKDPANITKQIADVLSKNNFNIYNAELHADKTPEYLLKILYVCNAANVCSQFQAGLMDTKTNQPTLTAELSKTNKNKQKLALILKEFTNKIVLLVK